MSFFVFSDYYRKMCVKLSYIVFVEAIVILLLTFVSMHANGAMSLACGAFAASLILFFSVRSFCFTTRACLQYVEIQNDAGKVILWSGTNKAMRSYSFKNIQYVQIVDLKTVTYASSPPVFHQDSYIYISEEKKFENENDFSPNVFNDSRCIVFSYNEYAYKILSSLLQQR